MIINPILPGFNPDPCICRINGKFYLSASGQRSVTLRISDTLEGLAEAEPVAVYTMPESDTIHANMWAPELHIICGVPYLFTTVGEKSMCFGVMGIRQNRRIGKLPGWW